MQTIVTFVTIISEFIFFKLSKFLVISKIFPKYFTFDVTCVRVWDRISETITSCYARSMRDLSKER